MITTLQQGDFTTIQDGGRWGYQAYGMPIAGAMDRYAYRMANILAGNQENAAVIEMTDAGASFKFDEEQLVAVCGADMQGKLGGKPISNWSSFFVPKQGELRFDAVVNGCRAYLAVRGGIEVPLVLGSRSTYTRAKIGGYEGRALRQGDVLYVGQSSAAPAGPRRLPSQCIMQYTPEVNLRAILGPQDKMFTSNAIQTFFTSTYIVTGQSDRTGYLLRGPKILPHGKEADIVSDAVGLGAIQIPSNGMPFIVTADHQTTRGFAKIAYVIQVDLPRLSQARTGDKIRFTSVTEEAAIEALQHEEQIVHTIARQQ
ncbi:biotin-dependent carboxyltransferase family protein [Sporomusa sp.]|uniref:5-oxoprolinase subunit C family protein n=1 Tax=Sporomusa sp. TaxID=2078658 RepID=UPI002C46C145|nr:biotin-dependent carboxyltransferase family protein [Sporomusa sp.]HWR45612.1 biotin-dependent carboxyltransferase family protein [Sporomusa sp.]